MKKTIPAILIAIALLLSLAVMMVACKDDGTEDKNNTKITTEASNQPTEKPTETPTEKPTETPTEKPTETPTEKPTEAPTEKPTEAPAEDLTPWSPWVN